MPVLNLADSLRLGTQIVSRACFGADEVWAVDSSGGAPPGGFTSLDPARTGSGITLSDANLTATGTGANISAALAPKLVSSAAYYWEATVGVLPSYVAVGVFPDSGTVDGDFLGGTDGAGAWSDGSTNTGPAYQAGSMFTYGSGDVLQLCLFGGLMYIGRIGDGWWNGLTSAFEPTLPVAANGHVFDVPDITNVSPAMSFFDGSTDAITFNFGASAFAGSVPAGCTGWPDH
jgi:hypothetical protein